MNVHVYVTNRPAFGVPYQAGPLLTSILSTSSAVHHSAVVGHSENLIRALAENDKLPLQNSVKGTFITNNDNEK